MARPQVEAAPAPQPPEPRGWARVRARFDSSKYGWNLAVAGEILVILLLWELLVSGLGVWNPRLLPPPSDVWDAFTHMLRTGSLARNVSYSMQNFVIGYLLAAAAGVISGFLLGSSRWVYTVFGPFMWAAYATPRITLQPILVLWLGFGMAPKILIIFLMAFFPIAINSMDGFRTVEEKYVRAGRVFGASTPTLYRKVMLPAALPFVLTGLQMGIARAYVGIVVGEFIGGTAGMGYVIERASAEFLFARSFTMAILLVVMSNLSMFVLLWVKRRLAPWHEGEVM